MRRSTRRGVTEMDRKRAVSYGDPMLRTAKPMLVLLPLRLGALLGCERTPNTSPVVAPVATLEIPVASAPAVGVPHADAAKSTSGDDAQHSEGRSDGDEPRSLWGRAEDENGSGGIGVLRSGNAGLGRGVTALPSIRQGVTAVSGRLPPEVIQRIVRQNFGRFRLCYENGLRTNPELAGRITVRFVIDGTGAVSSASDGGSDLPDKAVVGCVIRGFGNLAYPQPEGGTVTVVYPLHFASDQNKDTPTKTK